MGVKKKELLSLYRNESQKILEKTNKAIDEKSYTEKINRTIKKLQDAQIKKIRECAKREGWNQQKILEAVLMVRYTADIVMLERRNKVWPYDYMSFSRRIGELWEPFCKELFYHSIKKIEIIKPPTFEKVKEIKENAEAYIDSLPIEDASKRVLYYHYRTLWSILDSGSIKLELDLHFQQKNSQEEDIHYNCDFKSGFSSNEKGNTNRLLSVASIYRAIGEKEKMVLFVRQEEEENNHYLQTLKKSGYWDVFCADEAYEKMKDFTGFDLRKWLNENVQWEDDIDESLKRYLQENNLLKYLTW